MEMETHAARGAPGQSRREWRRKWKWKGGGEELSPAPRMGTRPGAESRAAKGTGEEAAEPHTRRAPPAAVLLPGAHRTLALPFAAGLSSSPSLTLPTLRCRVPPGMEPGRWEPESRAANGMERRPAEGQGPP